MRLSHIFILAFLGSLALPSRLPAQFGPANVIVAEVIERDVAPVQTFVATVTPLRKSVVGTAVPGRVEQFLFDKDNPETKLTYVTQGQTLCHLREGTVQIKVDQARAQRDLRKAEWEEASQTQASLVDEAKGKLQAMTEDLQFATNAYQRNRQLYESNGSISLDEYERSGTRMLLAKQQYLEAKTAAEILERGDRIMQAKARLDEAEAVLQELNDRVQKYTIRAPFDGFIVAEHTEVGEWVQEGDPIAEVVQLQPVEVRAYVPEKYVAHLKIGGEATVRPATYVATREALPKGKITGIIAETVSRSRTFPVKIQIDNPDHILKAGMLTEVEMEVGAKQPATLVPKDALVLGGPTVRIFVAVPDPKDPSKYTAKPMTVTQGAAIGKWIAVTAIGDEIIAGDLVVEKGNERLRPGAPLMVNREGATPLPKD